MRFVLILIVLMLSHHYSLMAQQQVSDELPIRSFVSKGSDDTFIIYVTGDGGWNKFSQSFTKQLVATGYNTIVLDSYKYFYSEKSPEVFTRDFESLTHKYLSRWHKEKVIVVGYSFGADVAAFLPGLLSDEIKGRLKFIALLSPSLSTDFEIRFSDMLLSNGNEDRKYKVEPVLIDSAIPILCVFGKEEGNPLRARLKKHKTLFIVDVPGEHQYNDDVPMLASMIHDFKW